MIYPCLNAFEILIHPLYIIFTPVVGRCIKVEWGNNIHS